ncbi:MAG: alpha/beta fold hydrolase [Gaiellaceae bacterium]
MRLHVHEWGDPGAPPLVCLHGVRGHGRVFRKLAEERLAARFRVVAFDLRGHGRSDDDPPWDLGAHLEDLEDTADAHGLARAVWLGHSFGGRLVMELVARAPERVERAVLLDPAIWAPPQTGRERAEGERPDRSYGSVEEAIVQRIVDSRLHHTPRALLAEEMDEHLLRSDDGRFRYRYCQSSVVTAYGEMSKPPPDFSALRLPTLLVRGALTDVVPEIFLDVYREGVGDALEVETVPGGHNVLWDAFAETADAVERYLG